jgi:hypothetical protein
MKALVAVASSLFITSKCMLFGHSRSDLPQACFLSFPYLNREGGRCLALTHTCSILACVQDHVQELRSDEDGEQPDAVT